MIDQRQRRKKKNMKNKKYFFRKINYIQEIDLNVQSSEKPSHAKLQHENVFYHKEKSLKAFLLRMCKM